MLRALDQHTSGPACLACTCSSQSDVAVGQHNIYIRRWSSSKSSTAGARRDRSLLPPPRRPTNANAMDAEARWDGGKVTMTSALQLASLLARPAFCLGLRPAMIGRRVPDGLFVVLLQACWFNFISRIYQLFTFCYGYVGHVGL